MPDHFIFISAIFFCLGIIAAKCINIPLWCQYFSAWIFLACSILLIKQNVKFNIFILLTAFFLGAACLKTHQILPDEHIARLIHKKADIDLIGVIDSDPVHQERSASFILKTERTGKGTHWRKTCGSVLVKVFKKDKFFYGDRLLLRGNIYRPFSFSRGFDYRAYLKNQNIYLILSVGGGSIVKQLGKNAGNPFKSLSLKLKHRFRKAILKDLSVFSAGLLNALILGDRQNLSRSLSDVLMNLGTIHIIAISGFNVGIVVFIILYVLKIIKVPRKPRYALTIVFMIIYCTMTGASPPVVRATIMGIIFLCSYFFEREANVYNSLGVALLIILGINPMQLFQISFQLSFLSVFFIVWLSPKIKSVFPENADNIPFLRFLILTFSVSSAAWIGLMPLIAYHFKIFTTITVLANMIVVPYSAVLTAAGFSFSLITILIPASSAVLAATNELLVMILVKIHFILIGIPGAYFRPPQVPFASVLFYYAILAAGFNYTKIMRLVNSQRRISAKYKISA